MASALAFSPALFPLKRFKPFVATPINVPRKIALFSAISPRLFSFRLPNTQIVSFKEARFAVLEAAASVVAPASLSRFAAPVGAPVLASV